MTCGATLLAVAGCGGSSGPSTDPARHAHVTFKSPAIVGGKLLARYTCDGQDISPPLEWSGVPPATKELAIFALGVTPEPGGTTSAASVEWAIAGINPTLHRLAAGALPPGAHIGHLGKKSRYSICPPKGKSGQYQFLLYAVPRSFTVRQTFSDGQLLLALAGRRSKTGATAGGSFAASYTRR